MHLPRGCIMACMPQRAFTDPLSMVLVRMRQETHLGKAR